MNTIGNISSVSSLQSAISPQRMQATRSTESTASFKNMLLDSIQEVNSMQMEANQAVEQLATGQEINPAEVLTAVQKADIAFKMMMQIRNKVVQAYQEVQNIRV